MPSRRHIAATALFATLILSATPALADIVLLLPAKGQVPGHVLSSILDRETRYAVIESGHTLVEDVLTQAAIREVVDGNPDTADEYQQMAKASKAGWVVMPTVQPLDKSYHLELTAYQVTDGRTESVSRDIDPDQIHKQITEMLKVLLRPGGVGTGALPWESAPPRLAPKGEGKTDVKTQAPGAGGTELLYLGVGAGISSALSRPDGAKGTSTSATLGARAGLAVSPDLLFGAAFATNASGPGAWMLEGTARYSARVGSSDLRIGAELGPGVFATTSGSKDKSFQLRVTPVVSVRVAGPVQLEAHLGDLRWVPASSGTVVLGGASAYGVLRF